MRKSEPPFDAKNFSIGDGRLQIMQSRNINRKCQHNVGMYQNFMRSWEKKKKKKRKKYVLPEFFNDEKLQVSKISPSIFPARGWIIL